MAVFRAKDTYLQSREKETGKLTGKNVKIASAEGWDFSLNQYSVVITALS